MAVTQADIDNLTRAIASGQRQVTIGSESVTYRSIDDLIKARDTLKRELDEANASAGTIERRPKAFKLYHAGRGY